MDWLAIDWGNIAAAFIAVGGGFAVYGNQKRLDRRSALIEKKREAYERYLRAYLFTDTKDRFEELNYSRLNAALLASDGVLRAIGSLDQYAIETSGSDTARDMERFTQLYAEVVMAMRKDGFEKTRLSLPELRRALPIR